MVSLDAGGIEMAQVSYGWHFVGEDKRLGYGDERKIRKGSTLRVDGPLVLCERGLHASSRALDALSYAPGPIACYVRLSGDIVTGGDKMCATERTIVAYVDARHALREFVRDTLVYRQEPVAVLCDLAGLPEHASAIRTLPFATSSLADIAAVFKAAADAAKAAWSAAWSAAWASGSAARAAGPAAWAAAGAAARAAAWSAEDAARTAAWDAAWAARAEGWAEGWAAAGASARAAARSAEDAAEDAAWDAAWSTAWDALNRQFEARLFDAMQIEPRSPSEGSTG